ncbi:MAG: hypothetical protein AB1465_05190 [Patescibacteria group bacterium]
MDYNKLFNSKIFKLIIGEILLLIFILFIFAVGVFIGTKKARFSYQWGENYHRNFAGPQNGFFGDIKGRFGEKDFIEAHGAIGQIVKIDGQMIILKGRDNIEKSILVNDKTTINRFREEIKLDDLKTDDLIVVIGDPNNAGQIEAKLIRVMPSPFGAFDVPLPPNQPQARPMKL